LLSRRPQDLCEFAAQVGYLPVEVGDFPGCRVKALAKSSGSTQRYKSDNSANQGNKEFHARILFTD
jgi:hypothetical protein